MKYNKQNPRVRSVMIEVNRHLYTDEPGKKNALKSLKMRKMSRCEPSWDSDCMNKPNQRRNSQRPLNGLAEPQIRTAHIE